MYVSGLNNILCRNNNRFYRFFSSCVYRKSTDDTKSYQRRQCLVFKDPKLYQSVRNYAFKSDLKIKWVRPPKIPSIKPEKSGDLEQLPDVDKKQIALEFIKSEELKTADELVKRLFTLEFQPRRKTVRLVQHEVIKSVQRHAQDRGSAESKIAEMTVWIRNMQQLMEQFPTNKRMKVRLKEMIERRKKFLKYLRRWDYKRFEWLLEKLNLVYKAPPSHFHWITRKDSLRKLTDKYCNDLRQQRLDAYKAALDAQKVSFLQEKLQKLQWIRKEEKECGVEPTVSESAIEQVQNLLKQLEVSNEKSSEVKEG